VKPSLDIFGSFVGRGFSRDIKRTSSTNFPFGFGSFVVRGFSRDIRRTSSTHFPFGGFFAEPSSGRPGRRTTPACFRSLCIPGPTPEAWQKLAQPVRAGKKTPLTNFPFGGFFAEPSFFRPSWIPITVAGGRAFCFREFHRNSSRVISRSVAPARRGGPSPSREFRNSFQRNSSRGDSSQRHSPRVFCEGPALLTFRSLGRAARIRFVGRGFSRDIKTRLSQTFLSAAFSPSLRFLAQAPRTFRPRVRSTADVRRNSRPTSSSNSISTRFWSKSRSYRKQAIKPPLPGSRIAYMGTRSGTRSLTR
jgi:hypothetical protein